MTRAENYHDAVAKLKLVNDAYLKNLQDLRLHWEPGLKAAQSEAMIHALNLTLEEVLEAVTGSPLSIIERVSLGHTAQCKLYDILPRQQVVNLVKNPRPITEVLMTVLEKTDAETKAGVIRHDMANDPRVTASKVGENDLYVSSFETREELIQFMMDKFGINRAKAEALATN